MFNFHELENSERERGYESFIKNKLHFFDIGVNVKNPNDKELYKTLTGKITDLENYDTVVMAKGADLAKHIKYNNMESDLKDLIEHLKQKPPFKIDYEKLDPTIVH